MNNPLDEPTNKIVNSDLVLTKKLLGKDKKLRAKIKSANFLKKTSEKYTKLHNYLTDETGGFLVPEENEQTLKFRQNDLIPLLPIENKRNIFDLKLDFGPYLIDFTRNGQTLALAGNKGHISLIDWKKKNLKCEFHVKETLKDIKFMHDDTLFAVAQKKYVYMYDNNGVELHKLKSHLEPAHLEFLPYHYLLVTSSRLGFIKYNDISTGKIVAEYQTKIKEPMCMKQNPHNALICIGDNRGIVSMFSPNIGQPLVKMICHKSAMLSCSLTQDGNYMVTTGNDNLMKVWDLRTYKKVFDYWTPKQAKCSDISQKGLLSISNGFQMIVWKDWYLEKQKLPYMKQEMFENNLINDLKFIPFEDFIGVGLETGFSNLVIPGAGESNFDTFEVNVLETKNQKREHLVKSLIEKLSPETIVINPHLIGNIDAASKEIIQAEIEAEKKEKEAKIEKKKRKKMRGRGGIGNEMKIKESVYDEKTREKLRGISYSKIKLKKAEKVKMKKELDILENLNEMTDLRPDKIVKKIKK